ncbi:MAG: metallophosphoesterase family protein [Planctomycetes bacterium]|nr:metallophosphoesterase family protein [Planctomycetota bacterium]
MKLGILSDTHGFLDPKVETLFQGVERILHAGDVGPGILERLARIAPVDAVAGNMDGEPLASRLPRLMSLDLAGRRVLLVHRPDEPQARARLESGELDILVCGHTHRAEAVWKGKVLVFNPGAAGRSMPWAGRTVGILEIGEGGVSSRILPLDG